MPCCGLFWPSILKLSSCVGSCLFKLWRIGHSTTESCLFYGPLRHRERDELGAWTVYLALVDLPWTLAAIKRQQPSSKNSSTHTFNKYSAPSLNVIKFGFKLFSRHRKKPAKLKASLVPAPSSLRDFSTHLSSNKVDSNEESTRYLSATARPASSSVKKTTFRPAVLLRSSPDLVAAAAAKAAAANPQNGEARYRNFNDLWVRLENFGHSQIRYSQWFFEV